jgi:DNA polymerase III delta prime subunit|tara:strand:- start:17180 stop:17845 length:666 start_codon:yes stop_codon:yes gene_type:complete
MKLEISQESLHHAYLLEEIDGSSVRQFCGDELKMNTRGNPDFCEISLDTFGIDDGRRLKELASRKPVSGVYQVFSISFNSITREAQNALLKLFEEPSKNTLFFISVSSGESLLPTLRSRLFLISGKRNIEDEEFAREFMKATHKKRIDLLKDIVDAKDKRAAIELLNNLEKLVRGEGSISSLSEENIRVLKNIGDIRQYLSDRSSSVKMILEHIAVTSPTF